MFPRAMLLFGSGCIEIVIRLPFRLLIDLLMILKSAVWNFRRERFRFDDRLIKWSCNKNDSPGSENEKGHGFRQIRLIKGFEGLVAGNES